VKATTVQRRTSPVWRIRQQDDLKRAIAEARKGKLVENAEVIDWLEAFIAKQRATLG
jgi:predicted transcriptional regulator